MQVTSLVTMGFNDPLLKKHALMFGVCFQNNQKYVDIEPADAIRYIGDFNGLMHFMRVPLEDVYYCMLLNGLRSSDEYSGLQTKIYLNSGIDYRTKIIEVPRVRNPKNQRTLSL